MSADSPDSPRRRRPGSPPTEAKPRSLAETTDYHAGPTAGGGVVLTPGRRPLPGYELVRFLGRGGFGEVWEAAGPGGFHVALKFIRMGDDAARVEMRSLELMKNLHHGHLLPTFGVWQHDGFLIIAMELATSTLHARLKEVCAARLPGVPLQELLGYMGEAAKGIDYLNEPRHPTPSGALAGIQHKDIKPANLLLVGGVVKVADFGLAKVLQRLTVSMSGRMTPAFAPPEFARNQATRWSDQYSLAVTYCLLRGGRLPFEGNVARVAIGHLTQPPDLRMVPRPERPALLRALAKNAEERWPTCGEFVAALAEDSRREAVASVAPRTLPAAALAPAPLGRPREPRTRQAKRAPARATASVGQSSARKLGRRFSRRRLAALLGGAAALVLLAIVIAAIAWHRAPPQTSAPVAQLPPAPTAPAATLPEPDPQPPAPAPPEPMTPPTNPMDAPAPPPRPPDPPKPDLQLVVAPELALDTGHKGFLDVAVIRRDCPGPIDVRVEGLPDGMTTAPCRIQLGQDKGVVEFTAGPAESKTAVRVTAVAEGVRKEAALSVTVENRAKKKEDAIAAIRRFGGDYSPNLGFNGGTKVEFNKSSATKPGTDAEAALPYLQALGGVQTLDLTGSNVSDAGLANLKGLTELRHLILGETKISNDGLARLEGLTGLQWLDLSRTQVTDDGLRHIRGTTDLKYLSLWQTRVSNAGLGHVKGLTSLAQLTLGYTKIDDAGLDDLRAMKSLTQLDLAGDNVDDAGLARLKDMTWLTSLRIDGTQVTDAGLAHLQGLTALQNLELGDRITNVGLANIKGLTGLRSLDLRGTKITDTGLENLKGMTGLTSLTVAGLPISNAGLKHLAGLTEMEDLDLSETKVTSAGLESLRAMTKMSRLNLSETKVSSAGLESLRAMTKLQILDVENTAVTKSAAASFQKSMNIPFVDAGMR